MGVSSIERKKSCTSFCVPEGVELEAAEDEASCATDRLDDSPSLDVSVG